MRNFKQSYFFKKEIFIKSSFKELSKENYKAYKKLSKEINEKRNQLLIEFYPEGGTLVSDIKSKILIKITDGLYEPVAIKGKIVDESNNIAASFETNDKGLSVIYISLNSDKKYNTIIDDNTKELKYSFPLIIKEGYTLSAQKDAGEIVFTVNTNKKETDKLFLVGYKKDDICTSQEITLTDGKSQVKINSKQLPQGIIQFSLFNLSMECLAERSVFNNTYNSPFVSFSPFKRIDLGDDTVAYVIRTQDQGLNPLISSLSLSIYEGKPDISKIYKNNIPAYLIFSSDLSEQLNSPEQYLAKDEKTEGELNDILIMHLPDKFDTESAISGKELTYPVQKGLNVKGKIVLNDDKETASDIPLNLSVTEKENNYIYYTNTDNKGNFCFNSLNFYGKPYAQINVVSSDESENISIVLDKSDKPEYSLITKDVINFDEYSIVKSKRINTSSSGSGSSSSMYGDPDYSLKFDETMKNYADVTDAIKGRIPGVFVNGRSIVIRGSKSFYGSDDPLILIDGIIIGISSLSSLDPKQLERVDVYSGSSAAAFGSRGANGALCFYHSTKDGNKNEPLKFQLKGYNVPENFISSDAKEGQIKTVYWKSDIVTNVNGYAIVKLPKNIMNDITVIIQGISVNGIPVAMSYKM